MLGVPLYIRVCIVYFVIRFIPQGSAPLQPLRQETPFTPLSQTAGRAASNPSPPSLGPLGLKETLQDRFLPWCPRFLRRAVLVRPPWCTRFLRPGLVPVTFLAASATAQTGQVPTMYSSYSNSYKSNDYFLGIGCIGHLTAMGSMYYQL